MLLPKSIKCNDLGDQPPNIKGVRRQSNKLTILIIKVWLLKCILPTICLVHGLNELTDFKSGENASSWSWFDAQSLNIKTFSRTFVSTTSSRETLSAADITGQSIRLCSSYFYYAESAHSFFTCLHQIASYLELSDGNTTTTTTINAIKSGNETKHALEPMKEREETYSISSHDTVSASTSAKNIKNFIEILELFLCLLIACCVELLPVGWQQLRQRQQRRIRLQFQGSSASVQQNLTQNDQSNENEAGNNFCLKLSLWQWLLSKKCKYAKPALNRKQQQLSKAKKCLNAFLTVKLPLAAPACLFSMPHQQEQALMKDTILQEYALIVWNIIVHEMTRITTNEIKTCCLMFHLTPPEGAAASPKMTTAPCSYENTNNKKRISKDRVSQSHSYSLSNSNSQIQNKKSTNNNSQICRDCNQVTETTSSRLLCLKRQYNNCVPSKNVCSFPNCHFDIDVAESKGKQKPTEGAYCSSSSTWRSLANECNTTTACCCCWCFEQASVAGAGTGMRECNGGGFGCCYLCQQCCCCSICCCFCNTICCNCSWSCCICRSKDCYCCLKQTFSCHKKTTQPARQRLQRLYELIFDNSISRYFQSICQSVRAKLLNYIQKLCSQKVKLYQRRQRQRAMQQHTVSTTSTLSQKKNFCIGHHGIANCTSNYQQLEASNVCKFFCNNRKRQRRRRRKRRRRRHRNCNINLQECRCTAAAAATVGQIIKSNSNCDDDGYGGIKDNFSSLSLKCNQKQNNTLSLLSSLISYLKSAVKTITNIYKSNNKNNNKKLQQPQDIQYPNDKIFSFTTTATAEQWQPTFKYYKKQIQQINQQQQNTHTHNNSNTNSLRRIHHCRGIKSWPNLAWLFIGLVWFESSRLVDCDLQWQMSVNEEGLTPERQSYRSELPTTHLNHFHECAQKMPMHEKFFSNQPLQRKYNNNYHQKRMITTNRNKGMQKDVTRAIENTSELSVLSDQIRLESIKNQILSKLGLTARPNVSHPLPKQFIWDTISRVDELDAIIKSFDFSAKANSKSLGKMGMGVWTFMDGFDHRPQTVQVRVHRNSTHATHQSYSEYSEQEQQQQLNLVPPPQQQEQIYRNKVKNNKKLTYLSGIASDTKVPVTLVEDETHMRKNNLSPGRYKSTNKEGNSGNNAVVSELHHYQQQLGNNGRHSNDVDIDNDDGQEYHGKTEEIISFAEEGDLFSQHRLIEFRTRANEVLSNEKLFVRNAEIHLRIDSVKPLKDLKRLEEGRKLKIWIFRMTETNNTNMGYDQQIVFCDAFEIDTHHLGWKKLDVTATVRDWFSLKKVGAIQNTERLRLLIDCTGCGDQYRLKLFEGGQTPKPKHQHQHEHEQHRTEGGAFKNDVVALWLQQQIENNNGTAKKAAYVKIGDESLTHRQPYSNPERPFLVIRTERHRARRVRRRVVDCSGALRGQCCKESFYVSFKALGWDDWIIAPRGYFANYCRGDCTGPFRTPDTFQTFHAHFIEEYRKMGLLNGMKPCCAPIKFSSMSLIYYGDDGIIKRDLPKMVVDECGCP